MISTQSNVFHFFHSHYPHFGLSKGMNESANYAKISLLKKKKKEDIRAKKTQSESFVSCCREQGANKRDKNKGNFSKKKKLGTCTCTHTCQLHLHLSLTLVNTFLNIIFLPFTLQSCLYLMRKTLDQPCASSLSLTK